ncbi:TIR domain-containing protein [Leifsonia shinshuensis]|uniref:TIR domain-containing protein n=1 Tax=Leifsonia shinshuensis TaxID=150026 RepID=A0A7G6Y7D8_9MICO|nr:TIR domain-containing protein [Leifsonia shinshuensis]QNE34403.1 TIR domain-containing protein [Leifsonia shinshuensis]
MEEIEYDFDVAVTFAGEDRDFVEEIVRLVQADGFSVFYDEDSKVATWGEDLTEYFSNVYEQRARFAVMFISASYAAKPWTRMERRSVLSRALRESSPYLLPVRLDSTALPGVRESIGYLDGLQEGPLGIADAIRGKLEQPRSDGSRRFNGRVPRTEVEVAVLLGERPTGWEYLLFSYWLAAGLERLNPQYNDHVIKFAIGGDPVSDEDLLDFSSSELARIGSVTSTFESLLLGPAQEAAMGRPGEPGDPELIEHLADRMIAIYAELLSWEYRLRAAATWSDEARELLRALANYANQPIDEIHRFVLALRAQMDGLSEILQSGKSVDWSQTIEFVIPEEVSKQYLDSLEAFKLWRQT